MQDHLKEIVQCIETKALPETLSELFLDHFEPSESKFLIQENNLIDFKEHVPQSYATGYGAGIIRLILSMYNTYGGLIIFGVRDGSFECVGANGRLDVEAINRFLSDLTGVSIETFARAYRVPRSDGKTLEVLLVPRRTSGGPAKLRQELDRYPAGTVWVRQRHEVLVAKSHHFPLLYSNRNSYLSGSLGSNPRLVHRSLPPSPATMKDFIGRHDLMAELWEWFCLSDRPRLYLHGPGGSGKSTLAYEFARAVADAGEQLVLADNQVLDYVIYISGKETEFNSIIQKEQVFLLRNFEDVNQQFSQILYHAGLINKAEACEIGSGNAGPLLDNLFAEFSGLIIIDDIDALSRRNLDTGEELLFLKAALSRSRTRILYTLRYVPPYALHSSIAVPGLNPQSEFFDFVASCSKQFNVPQPNADDLVQLDMRTDRLPLLVETVVGLRRICGSFRNALQVFDDRGGDDARRYLYSREYDALDKKNRSRALLAVLSLLESPVSFEGIYSILRCSTEQVRDAISETSRIFLRTTDFDGNETRYELAPPAVHFVKKISSELDVFDQIKRAVHHYRTASASVAPKEAPVIARLDSLIRQRKYEDIIFSIEQLDRLDAVRSHPRLQAILGQACSNLDPPRYEEGREAFRAAEGLKYIDIFMMRSWFYMEMKSGYSLREAERVCELVVCSEKFTESQKAEFYSKLAYCLHTQARQHFYIDAAKAIPLMQKSLEADFSSLWLGRDMPREEAILSTERMAQRAHDFFRLLSDGVIPLFDLLENLIKSKFDFHPDFLDVLVSPLRRVALSADSALRARVAGLCGRTLAAASAAPKKGAAKQGLRDLQDRLGVIITELRGR